MQARHASYLERPGVPFSFALSPPFPLLLWGDFFHIERREREMEREREREGPLTGHASDPASTAAREASTVAESGPASRLL